MDEGRLFKTTGLHSLRDRGLWGQFADARVPDAQGSARATATAEWAGLILSESTRLPNVLRGYPDRVADSHCRTVITPTRARGIADVGFVAGEAIIRAQTRFDDVD